MTKKRAKNVKASKKSRKVVNAEKAITGQIGSLQKKVVEEAEHSASFFSKIFKKPKIKHGKKEEAAKVSEVPKKADDTPFFSKFFESNIRPKSAYRQKEEKDLRGVEWGVNDLVVEKGTEKISKKKPVWFYISSIFAAFLFVVYISVYATIHFESIEYMNITIVFLFITMVSFFLISSIFFISEKKKWHAAAPLLFFIGFVSIMIYAFKAVDTSNLVRFSIMYTIIVAAISTYVLAVKKE